MEKKCIQCGEIKRIEEFYKRGDGKWQGCCKQCHSANIKKKYNERIKQIIDYKSSIGCKKCGDKRGYLLEFHHKDPSIKEFEISNHARTPLKNMMEEVSKCVLLCANCHREFHWLEKKNHITLEEYLESKP